VVTVYLTLVIAGTACSAVLTPLVSAAANTLGLVDAPGGRKVHSAPVPRLGGLAVAAAGALALGAAALLSSAPRASLSPLAGMTPILAGSAIVLTIGLIDDIRGLSPSPKLLAEIAAALIVMLADLRIERITIADQTWGLGNWSWPITLLWIVGLTNAFNLIDGIDGLAAGVAVIAGSACATILVLRGHTGEAMLLAALVGAALGFLLYNFPPASIFLGDGGSLLFGFVLATTAITGWQKGATALAAGVPVMIFALPIADAATAVFRRLVRGHDDGVQTLRAIVRRVLEPDREHIHHRLLSLGLSTRRAVVLLYAVTFVLSMLALATARLE
jgi:UDP-GlcNAc:undecaprenyl-phosphate GlcNAc-1-phosphate transferase